MVTEPAHGEGTETAAEPSDLRDAPAPPGRGPRRPRVLGFAVLVVMLAVAGGFVAMLELRAAASPSSVATTQGVADPSPEPSAAGVATAPPAEVGTGPVKVSDSGNVLKDLGEPAGLTLADSERAFFVITIDAITVTTSCPGRGVSVAPVNGYFVVLDVAASMPDDALAAAGSDADLFMPLVADAFHVVGLDGSERTDTLTEASWACFPDEELAPPFVGAGEIAAGKVVLDSAVDRGTLVYAPAGPGWEWAFSG
jgi:ABC-type Na+ efflux pump permease subunit